jgi:hypothetical protein
MTYGIGSLRARLDVLDPARRAPTELDWPGVQNWITGSGWNSGKGPQFAVRNFMTGQFQCAVAEPAKAQAQMNTLARIVPIARPDLTRLATAGDEGLEYGETDARVFCERIGDRIAAEEFDIPTRVIYLYLDVPPGAVLTPDYWAGWADVVHTYQLTRLVDHVVGTITIPSLQISQPFLPAISAPFDLDLATSKWTLGANVTTCLNAVAAAYPGRQVRCYGFWAEATDPAKRVFPNMPLDWTQLPIYRMPLSATASQPVWILGWRYTEQATIPDASFAAGTPISLEATQEGTLGVDLSFDRMLTIKNWSVTEASASEWGFDCSVSTEPQINCLRGQTVFGHQITFVCRYSDIFVASHHHLDWPERVALDATMMKRVIVWESPRNDPAGNVLWPADRFAGGALIQRGSDYFAQAFGYQDGRDAFAKGADFIRQGAHSPIYFAVDFDALAGDAANLRRYFQDVERAYADYLADQLANKRDVVPFSIGVYGPIFALELCYREGICSYFWQAFGGGFSGGRNRDPFRHDNIFQRSNSAATHDTLCTLSIDFNIGWGDVGGW